MRAAPGFSAADTLAVVQVAKTSTIAVTGAYDARTTNDMAFIRASTTPACAPLCARLECGEWFEERRLIHSPSNCRCRTSEERRFPPDTDCHVRAHAPIDRIPSCSDHSPCSMCRRCADCWRMIPPC